MATKNQVPRGKQRVRKGPGIYLKATGVKRWLATYRDPGGKQRWKTFLTKAEAERWRAEGRFHPEKVCAGKRRLSEIWEDFRKHHMGRLRPSTLKTWEQEWRKHLGPAFGSWPVGHITVAAIKDWLAEMEGHAGEATRIRCRTILQRLLNEAVENGEISSNPASVPGTRVKRGQSKRARILSADEFQRLVAAAEEVAGSSDALAIETMFNLGLRIGEMAGLRVKDVDVRLRELAILRTVSDLGGRLIVQQATKTGELRVIPLPPDMPLWSKLVAHVHGRPREAPLFPAPRGGPIRLTTGGGGCGTRPCRRLE